jgi:hypothetical protein
MQVRHHLGFAASIVSVGLMLAALPIQAQKKDPFVGTWELNPEKSTFTPGPAPASRSMTFEMMKDGSLHHLTRTPGFVGFTQIDYTAKFDGKDYTIIGTGLDTVSLKRVDENTIERTGKERGKEAEMCTMKVSPDHKMLTMTVKGSYNGVNYSSVQVYERE